MNSSHELASFEDSAAHTVLVQVGKLHRGDLVMLKGHPCRVNPKFLHLLTKPY